MKMGLDRTGKGILFGVGPGERGKDGAAGFEEGCQLFTTFWFREIFFRFR